MNVHSHAGGYNYPFWRGKAAAPHGGLRKFYSADLGFPVAAGLMWLASLQMLLSAISQRLKVCSSLPYVQTLDAGPGIYNRLEQRSDDDKPLQDFAARSGICTHT